MNVITLGNFLPGIIPGRLFTFRATSPFQINPGSSRIWLPPLLLYSVEGASVAQKQTKQTGVSGNFF